MTPKEKKKFRKTVTAKKTERKSRPFLSVCMMMRDEEKNLPRILESIKKLEIADEICILDTGSSDRSVEVAESYGAKVKIPEDADQYFEDTQFGRKLNFSKARNASIGLTKGEWLLIMDADEEIVGDGPGLKSYLKKLTGDFDAVSVQFVDIQGGKSQVKFPPPRVFKKGCIRYEGIVHNSPHGFKEPVAFFKDLEVRHYGYDLTPEQTEEKRDRTLGLLLKRLQDNPTDFAVYFYLAQVYGSDQNYDRSIEYCVKYIRNQGSVERYNTSIYYTLVQACIAADNPSMADKWLAEAVRELPQDIDIAMALIDYGVWQGKVHVVAAACEKYVLAYEAMLSNPLSSSSRFVYNFNEYSLVKVLFHLGMIRLDQGIRIVDKMEDAFKDLDQEMVEGVKKDIREHIAKFKSVKWIKLDGEGI
jgi:glycosyltransferase involved in cell wall biosynthesis